MTRSKTTAGRDPSTVRPAVPPPPLVAGEGFGGWEARPSLQGGLALRRDQADLVTMKYVYFAPQWKFAGAKVVPEPAGGFRIDTRLPIQTRAEYQLRGARTLAIVYDLEVEQDLVDVPGIGAELRFQLDSSAWPEPPDPRISADGKTLTLAAGGKDVLTLTLESPLGGLHFERGNEAIVRAMFAKGRIPKGDHRVELRLELPEGGRVAPPLADAYGNSDPAQWHADALVWNDWPVDVSFLGRGEPAGKRGRVRVDGERLVFEDGTPARFWGTNVVAYSLFVADKEAITTQAERLAALGFNLVRLHHHDSHWQRVNVFDKSAGTTQELDDRALDNLDWWIKSLQERGIYVWIDVHVGRQFVQGDDIAGFDEIERVGKGQAKGFNYVNPRVEALMRGFASTYLTRKNRYTGRTWASDPAVVGYLITNENDLVDHMGNLFVPKRKLEHHLGLFEAQAKAIARELGLPLPQALHTWKPGAPKKLLAELQHRFDARALTHLRSLGVEGPIATTNYWGHNGFWSLLPLTAGDVIDVHSYGEEEALGQNPRHAPTLVHFIAGAQVPGKPLTVTEWNIPREHVDRFVGPPYVASIGALQGWDALMLYCYSQDPIMEPRRLASFSTWIDPAIMALSPAMAVLFRRGDVDPARSTVVIAPSEEALYASKQSGETSRAVRTAAEQHKVLLHLPEVEALPWVERGTPPPDAEVVTDLEHDFLGAEATQVVSDTGQVRRDWARGIQTIDTPRSQLVSGWIGGHRIPTADAAFEIETAKAVVVLTALDEKPIADSARILVTAVARADEGEGGRAFRSEPVRGRIAIRSARPLVLRPLSRDARGRPAAEPILEPEQQGDLQIFELPAHLPTHWFVLAPP